MTKEELQKLIDRYLNNEVTPQERKWVNKWYSSFHPIDPEWDKSTKRQLRNDIYQTFARRLALEQEKLAHKSTRRLYRLIPYAAAAVLICCLAYFFYATNYRSNTDRTIGSYVSDYDQVYPDRTTIILDDGQEIQLNSSSSNLQIKDGSIVNEKADIILSKKQLSGTSFLTLITPQRSKYQLTLSDGSRVWLDAGSRITCPVSFEGQSRIVQASGQLYFSVSKHPDKPFIVKTSEEEVKVLGTEFILNHYRQSAISYVALLEGSVNVSIPNHGAERLTPGNMVEITGNKAVIKPASIEELSAWKNDEFVFNDQPLKQVMIELSRWYNVEYQIDPTLMESPIWGTMSRKESLEANLENLQKISTGIRFEIKEGRVLIMK